METLRITPTAVGIRLSVWAKPKASKSRVLGVREGALEVAVAAPPVDGAANEAIVATLAKALGVPRRAVTLVAGLSGKSKVVEIEGLSAEEARAALIR